MKKIKMGKKSQRRILITGGGTGGHLYPAMAIIDYIRTHYPGTGLLFIGSDKGMGKKLIPSLGVKFIMIRVRGLSAGRGIFGRVAGIIRFIACLFPGFLKAVSVIRQFRPDMVLGMGGYFCTPVLLAARFMGVDYAVHEQNYLPGRANRFFAGCARYVFLSFPDTSKYLKIKKGSSIVSGNPVRRAVIAIDTVEPLYGKWGLLDGRFTVTAFGGSLGAEKINREFLRLYDYFRDNERIQFLLICGERFYGDLEGENRLIEEKKDRVVFRIFPYIDEMQQVYRISDLVIARAGANTVFELIAANIPSILVPYPLAADDHQYYNARYLAERGKSILIRDNEFSAGLVFRVISDLMSGNMRKIKNMKNAKINTMKMDSAQIISSYLIGDEVG
ncbi:MAG: UDP-N-acetylglucosamine--N-acetylmuramyl-(pentapeptide) pyrophosphoryl-undecaprenol N-acetylglucosamine transferase [Actinobacteria bacterium]|nr:UDP-N-acetylglucosamine--N-acetylmuramyl-(pentapeptide) pyrophosphoryl-undecaprenol N-acetylglucosamine transferase [Actinomycetota bacterium]